MMESDFRNVFEIADDVVPNRVKILYSTESARSAVTIMWTEIWSTKFGTLGGILEIGIE